MGGSEGGGAEGGGGGGKGGGGMTQPNSKGDGVGVRHVREVPSGEIEITRP